jgi:hypothetical protein
VIILGILWDQVEIVYPKVPSDFLQILFQIGGYPANSLLGKNIGAPAWQAHLSLTNLLERSRYSKPDCVSFTAVLEVATPK